MNLLFSLSVFAMVFLAKIQQATILDEYRAKLETNLQGEMLSVKSVFINNSTRDVEFTYRFISSRTGKAGTSANKQFGTVKAAPGQEILLSQTAFSVTPTDTYSLQLEILDKNKVVAQDSFIHKGQKL